MIRHMLRLNCCALLLTAGCFFLPADWAVAQPAIPQSSESGLENAEKPAEATISDQSLQVAPPIEASAATNTAGDTKLTQDLFVLQEQNTLLNALIERQSQIQRFAMSYKNSGASYTQPAPPAEACEKLPRNLLCMMFYPDLDQNKGYVEDTLAKIKADMAANLQAAMMNADIGANGQMLSDLGIAPTARYQWKDISCLGAQCSALIIDENSPRRLRVSDGQEIDQDLTVASVTKDGVILLKDGEEIVLDAAKIDNDASTGNSQQQSIDALLDNKLSNVPPYNPAPPAIPVNEAGDDTAAPAPAADNEAKAPAPVQDVSSAPDASNNAEGQDDAPMLGPTGLF